MNLKPEAREERSQYEKGSGGLRQALEARLSGCQAEVTKIIHASRLYQAAVVNYNYIDCLV